jgi:hypothetical protein
MLFDSVCVSKVTSGDFVEFIRDRVSFQQFTPGEKAFIIETLTGPAFTRFVNSLGEAEGVSPELNEERRKIYFYKKLLKYWSEDTRINPNMQYAFVKAPQLQGFFAAHTCGRVIEVLARMVFPQQGSVNPRDLPRDEFFLQQLFDEITRSAGFAIA